jgi:hypothetical protein
MKPKDTSDPLDRNPYLPVNLQDREREKKRIREEQLKNLPRLLDCLDPAVAKHYEDRKPLYEWKVSCRMFRPAVGSHPSRMEELTRNVVAQSENDAWAMFCDAVGEWPSRRGCNPKIEMLKRRTLRDSQDEPHHLEQAATA